jgi:hypothetical protein
VRGAQTVGGDRRLLLGWLAWSGLASPLHQTPIFRGAGRVDSRVAASSRLDRWTSPRGDPLPAVRARMRRWRRRRSAMAVTFSGLETPGLFKDGAGVVVGLSMGPLRRPASSPSVPEVRGRGAAHQNPHELSRTRPDAARPERRPVSDLGFYALGLALVVALAGLAAGLAGGFLRRADLSEVAMRAVVIVLVLTGVAMLVLFHALATGDTQLQYVAAHSASTMPLGYRLAALWGGQAGSLLLWLWMLSLYGTAAVLVTRRAHRALMPWVARALGMQRSVVS